VTRAALLNVIGFDKMKLAVDMALLERRGVFSFFLDKVSEFYLKKKKNTDILIRKKLIAY
jgi:hypothetical protein